jgi:mannose-6-phosphate isomerase-like protein (cupin superfamily)
MADYTIKNLGEIEDMASQFGMDGMEARFARKPLELESTGLSYQRVGPKVRVPFGHTHQDQEEIYVVLSGSGRLKLDDDVVDVKQLDAVRIGRGTMRDFEAGPNGAAFLAFGASSIGENDAEMTPNWWSD